MAHHRSAVPDLSPCVSVFHRQCPCKDVRITADTSWWVLAMFGAASYNTNMLCKAGLRAACVLVGTAGFCRLY